MPDQSALDRIHVARLLQYAHTRIKHAISYKLSGPRTPAQMEQTRANAQAILDPMLPALKAQGITVSPLKVEGQDLVATQTFQLRAPVESIKVTLLLPQSQPIQHYLPKRLRSF